MTVSISVSCIIPTHLRAKFLVEALASVGAQTTPPIEIVVVSDTADEATADVVAAFAQTSPIPVILEFSTTGHGGASASRNRGAELASGEAFAFLDDDDTWETGFLEGAVAVLEEERVDSAVAWMNMFMGGLVKVGPSIRPGLTARDVVAVNPGVTGSNMVVRKSAFDRIHGFDPELRMKNDTDFFFRHLKSGGSYGVVGARLVNQRKHSSGQLTGHSLARAEHTEAYLRKHRGDLTRSDRRHIRFVIYRIRSNASGSAALRLQYKALALLNYSYEQFSNDRANRRDRDFFTVPSIAGATTTNGE